MKIHVAAVSSRGFTFAEDTLDKGCNNPVRIFVVCYMMLHAFQPIGYNRYSSCYKFQIASSNLLDFLTVCHCLITDVSSWFSSSGRNWKWRCFRRFDDGKNCGDLSWLNPAAFEMRVYV
jgi:hypothetical protein